jgi:hypothetical protein
MWSTRVNLRKKTQFLLRFLRIFHNFFKNIKNVVHARKSA